MNYGPKFESPKEAAELYQTAMNEERIAGGRPTRRGVIAFLAGAVSSFALANRSPQKTVLVKKLGKRVDLSQAQNSTRLDFRELFGIVDSASIIPGTGHPNYYGRVHPNNYAAAKALAENAFLSSERLRNQISEQKLLLTGDLNRSLVAIGSPTSSLLARLVLDYRDVSSNPHEGLMRRPDPILHLPYEYVLITDILKQFRELHTRSVDGKDYVVPNWWIRDTRTSDPVVPDDKSIKDHLLLIFTRNFLSVDAFDNGRRLVIQGGAHGHGTLAGNLVFGNRQIEQKLKLGLEQFGDFQARISVTATEVNSQGTTIATEIDASNIDVLPIEVDVNARREVLDELTRMRRAFVAVGALNELEKSNERLLASDNGAENYSTKKRGREVYNSASDSMLETESKSTATGAPNVALGGPHVRSSKQENRVVMGNPARSEGQEAVDRVYGLESRPLSEFRVSTLTVEEVDEIFNSKEMKDVMTDRESARQFLKSFLPVSSLKKSNSKD
jgi:hypothetical protein